jgi:hypothetical protein
MNARDELRGTLSNTICHATNYPERAQPYLLGGDMSTVLDRTADAILAAGYRKPRTITTAEELDALPLNTIILDAEGLPLHKDDSDRVEEWCYGDNAVDVDLPATVLYEPQP